jgi:hypothetical protein
LGCVFRAYPPACHQKPSRSTSRSFSPLLCQGLALTATLRMGRVASKASDGGGPTGTALLRRPGRLPPRALRLPRRAYLVSKHTPPVKTCPIGARKKSPIWGMRPGPPRYYNLIIVRSGALCTFPLPRAARLFFSLGCAPLQCGRDSYVENRGFIAWHT